METVGVRWADVAALVAWQVVCAAGLTGLFALLPVPVAWGIWLLAAGWFLGTWAYGARVSRRLGPLPRPTVKALSLRAGGCQGALAATTYGLVAWWQPEGWWMSTRQGLAMLGASFLLCAMVGTILTLCGLDLSNSRAEGEA